MIARLDSDSDLAEATSILLGEPAAEPPSTLETRAADLGTAIGMAIHGIVDATDPECDIVDGTAPGLAVRIGHVLGGTRSAVEGTSADQAWLAYALGLGWSMASAAEGESQHSPIERLEMWLVPPDVSLDRDAAAEIVALLDDNDLERAAEQLSHLDADLDAAAVIDELTNEVSGLLPANNCHDYIVDLDIGYQAGVQNND